MKFNSKFVNIISLITLSLLTCSDLISSHLESHNRLLVISFDGFRGDYLSPILTPNLWSIMKNGVTGSMYPMFPSKTFPNHFSIATGLHPESHGIVDNRMYDPEFDEIFIKSSLDPKWWDNGHSLPLWIANELSGHTSGVAMWPGCCTKYRGRSASYMYNYNKTMSLEERVEIVFDWMTKKENPANLAFLYINQPDSSSHAYGPFSDQVIRQIMHADRFAAYLMEGLKNRSLSETTNIIFLSDHGMSEIHANTSANLTQILDTSLFRHFGETQVIGILPVEGAFNKVYQMLVDNASSNHYKVYTKSQIPEQYSYRNNRRIQPIIIEAEPGYEITFCDRAHDQPFWGNHGNDNKQPDMRSLFIGYGPRFKKGFELTKSEFFNIDLYPLMAKILNIDLHGYSFNGTDELTGQFLN